MTAFQPRDRVHLKGHAHVPATTGTVEDVTPFRVYVRWDDGTALTPHDYETLDPGGEPMSQTFKSIVSNREVRIWPTNAGFAVAVLDDGLNESMSTQLAPSDAPALALAAFASVASSGVPVAPEVARAMEALEEYKQRIQTEAEEAADRDAFQAEAVALYRAYYRALYEQETGLEWADLDHDARVLATALATTARELHPESTR